MLVFAARGIIQRDRHLMKDLKAIMPHSKDENKMERREQLSVINEVILFLFVYSFTIYNIEL